MRNFTRKKKDSNYGKAVSTNSLQAESIFIAKVNPDGDTRDRRTIEEIQQVMAIVMMIIMMVEIVMMMITVMLWACVHCCVEECGMLCYGKARCCVVWYLLLVLYL